MYGTDDVQNQNNQLITELTNQLAKLLQTNNETQRLPDSLKINVSLNNTNFSLWSRMIKEDLIVFSRLIQNIEPQIASNLTQFPTTKSLWEALITTYSAGKDKLQTFDLHVKANNIRQESKSIEELWLQMQGIWGEIEMRDPNPMEHPNDIVKYNNIRSEQKLFQFLNALDRKHDNIKRELLRLEPLPTVEGAYAAIRKENAHQNIFGTKTDGTNNFGIGSGLLAPSSSKSKETEGQGLITKNHRRQDQSTRDKEHLRCTECGMKRQTKEQCFRIVGYPEWWNDGHRKGKAAVATATTAATKGNQETSNSGATAVTQGGFGLMAAEPPSSGGGNLGLGCQPVNWERTGGLGVLTPNQFNLLHTDPPDSVSSHINPSGNLRDHINPPVDEKLPIRPSINKNFYDQSHTIEIEENLQGQSFLTNNVFSNKNDEWIIDCGATVTMTFDKNDIYLELKPSKTKIKMANGGTVQVKGGGTDIRTGKIVGRGTERDGLYYVDEVTQDGTTMLAHGTPNRQAWLCHQGSYKTSDSRSERPFALIHSDVWRPARFKSKIQILRTDNGGEYVNTQMKLFCETKGIIYQTTCPHTPQQNGVSERKNRILLEITRALMIESNVPKSFWPEALATATYLLNRLPTRALDFKNPLETLAKFYKPPSNLTLKPRIFRCTVFVHIPKGERTKLDLCAEKCVFVDYGINQKGYRCYSPKRRHMFTSMNCDFLETEYYYTQHTSQGESESSDSVSWLDFDLPSSEEVTHSNPPTSTSDNDLPNTTEVSSESFEPITTNLENEVDSLVQETGQTEEQPNQQSQPNQPTEPEPEPPHEQYVLPPRVNRGIPPKRYSPERGNPKSRYPMANIAKGNISHEAKQFTSAIYSEKIPNTVEEALKSPNWKKAMEDEMKALMANNTWEKCMLPESKKPFGCRWVFTIKHKADGTIERYKARLVAKGYT
ncbi:uncharacterized protein [Rutidosis leptorrhynchoides]|uniref:uncharacterized protein n=1 Tax=Rutidosis leptorrhynchoides TaxID=125765 RepID=UPI003A996424